MMNVSFHHSGMPSSRRRKCPLSALCDLWIECRGGSLVHLAVLRGLQQQSQNNHFQSHVAFGTGHFKEPVLVRGHDAPTQHVKTLAGR